MAAAARHLAGTVLAASKPSRSSPFPSLDQTLRHLLPPDLSPSLVAAAIDPHLLRRRPLAAALFRCAARRPGFAPDPDPYHALLRSLSLPPPRPRARPILSLLAHARARRVPLLPASYHLAVAALLASDAPREALALFDLATSDAPAADLPGDLYNSLLAAASDSLAIARKVFDRMLERGVAFKDVGFGCFIGKLCRSEVLGEVLGLVDKIKARTEGINGSIMAALIVDGLCRTGRIEEAWRALGELRMRGWKPDFIAYRIVSEGFRLADRKDETATILKQKRKLGVAPKGK